MKAYITKYALTQGIIEVEAEVTNYPGMIKVPSMGLHSYFHGEGKTWHRTKESAIKRAEQLRAKKLKSIELQKRRIEKIVFEIRANDNQNKP